MTEIHTDNEVNLGSTKDILGFRKVKLIQQASEMHEKYCERRVRVLKERMRSIQSELLYQLPKRLYYRLALWATQGMNTIPDSLCTDSDVRSSRERVTGKKPDMKILTKHHFGKHVLYHITNHDSSNLGPRGGTGIVVGRDLESGNFMVYNPAKDSTVTRKALVDLPITEVVIKELNTLASQDENAGNNNELIRLDATDSLLGQLRESYEEMSDTDSDYDPSVNTSDTGSDDSYSDEGELIALPEDDTNVPEDLPPESEPPRYSFRPSRGIGHALVASGTLTVSQALQQHGPAAEQAIAEELSKMLEFEAFEPPSTKPTSLVIPSSMFIKEKTKADGSFDKLKARLVAGGHRQEWGENDTKKTAVFKIEILLTNKFFSSN